MTKGQDQDPEVRPSSVLCAGRPEENMMLCSGRKALQLLLLTLAVTLLSSEAAKAKRRKKRDWVPHEAILKENTDYRKDTIITKIRSDKDMGQEVRYFISGKGVEKFTVDHETGIVRVVAASFDREECPKYHLSGTARFMNGTAAEENIPITVEIMDENDHPPVFKLQHGSIKEMSAKGAFVMTLRGQDGDESGTVNAQLHYTIISQEPAGEFMFAVDAKSGNVTVKEATLDRERLDFFKLGILVKDMGGAAGALSCTGTVEIKIEDINDNKPTLDKTEYEISVYENFKGEVKTRIQVTDLDLEYSENWLAKYRIVKGNERGFFSIETDKKTNEGVLKLIKAVDYEQITKISLELEIENVAKFVKTSTIEEHSIKVSCHIKISIINVPEHPGFWPQTKEVVAVGMNTTGRVIVTYKATYNDTRETVKNVTYAIRRDYENAITVHYKTAEVRLIKVIRRESRHVVKGIYTVEIVGVIEEGHWTTATGTISIKVYEENSKRTVKYAGSIITLVVAVFLLLLLATCLLVFCQCASKSNKCRCFSDSGSNKGTYFSDSGSNRDAYFSDSDSTKCMCFSFPEPNRSKWFRESPFEPEEHLIPYSTEGGGRSKEVYRNSTNKDTELGGKKKEKKTTNDDKKDENGKKTKETETDGNGKKDIRITTREESIETTLVKVFVGGRYIYIDREQYLNDRNFYSTLFEQWMVHDQSVLDTFLLQYYTEKVALAVRDEAREEWDELLLFRDEGRCSPAGSVGCCSLLESENDLQFLDDLGPKFKILADVCVPPALNRPLSQMSEDQMEITIRNGETVLIPRFRTIVEGEMNNTSSVRRVSAVSPPPLLPLTLPRPQGGATTSHFNKTSSFTSLSNLSASNASRHVTLPRPTAGLARSTSNIHQGLGASRGFSSRSLASRPLSPTVYFSRLPGRSVTTSPSVPTFIVSPPSSPDSIGIEGWETSGPLTKSTATLVGVVDGSIPNMNHFQPRQQTQLTTSGQAVELTQSTTNIHQGLGVRRSFPRRSLSLRPLSSAM